MAQILEQEAHPTNNRACSRKRFNIYIYLEIFILTAYAIMFPRNVNTLKWMHCFHQKFYTLLLIFENSRIIIMYSEFQVTFNRFSRSLELSGFVIAIFTSSIACLHVPDHNNLLSNSFIIYSKLFSHHRNIFYADLKLLDIINYFCGLVNIFGEFKSSALLLWNSMQVLTKTTANKFYMAALFKSFLLCLSSFCLLEKLWCK